MSRKKREAEQLKELGAKVSQLVALTTIDLNELRTALAEQGQTIGQLIANFEALARDAAVLETRHEGLAADVEEVREVNFNDRNVQAAGTYNALGDVDVTTYTAPAGAIAENQPYQLHDALNLYVSGDGDAYDTAIQLLQEARAAHQDPVNLLISVQWEPAENGEPAYFAGNLAVSQ